MVTLLGVCNLWISKGLSLQLLLQIRSLNTKKSPDWKSPCDVGTPRNSLTFTDDLRQFSAAVTLRCTFLRFGCSKQKRKRKKKRIRLSGRERRDLCPVSLKKHARLLDRFICFLRPCFCRERIRDPGRRSVKSSNDRSS